MIVELFGVTGVGKSVLSTELRRLLDERDYPYVAVGAKVPYGGDLPFFRRWLVFMASAARNPGTAVAIFTELVGLAFGEGVTLGNLYLRSRVVLKWWTRLAIQIAMIHRFKETGGLHLLERGIAANLLSAVVRLDRTDVAPLAGILARAGAQSDVVVVVEARRETVLARRETRGGADKFWMQDHDAEWRKFEIVKAAMTQHDAAGPGRIVAVNANADDDLATNGRRLYRDLVHMHEAATSAHPQDNDLSQTAQPMAAPIRPDA